MCIRDSPDGPGQPESVFVGSLFIIFASVFILAGWAFAVVVLVEGKFLARRTRYTYCLVVAGVECIFMPFGTVLGVFTIIVLSRPSVKALFGQKM